MYEYIFIFIILDWSCSEKFSRISFRRTSSVYVSVYTVC